MPSSKRKRKRDDDTSSSDTSSDEEEKRRKKKKREKKKKRKRKKSKAADAAIATRPLEPTKKPGKKKKKRKSSDSSLDEEEKKRTREGASGSRDTNRNSMRPMTKEEWEKKQSVVRRVYDESTGRSRLIKGDGEVLEEIVSKTRHQEINRRATAGDGNWFQSKVGLNRK